MRTRRTLGRLSSGETPQNFELLKITMMRGDEVLCVHLLQEGCPKYMNQTSLLHELLGQAYIYIQYVHCDDGLPFQDLPHI